MAHRSLAQRPAFLAIGALALAAIAACGTEPAKVPPGGPEFQAAKIVGTWAADDASAWGTFHSKRFFTSIPLPQGKTWKIDDRSRGALLAVHEPTSSKLHLESTSESELMNRQKCEAKARERGWVPAVPLTTVEERVVTGPDAYDSRIWVALDAGRPGGGLEGHVFLFGGFLRKCLLVHLQTKVPAATDEDVLSTRLAIAESRIVRAITIDAPRTTDEAVPRDKPQLRH